MYRELANSKTHLADVQIAMLVGTAPHQDHPILYCYLIHAARIGSGIGSSSVRSAASKLFWVWDAALQVSRISALQDHIHVPISIPACVALSSSRCVLLWDERRQLGCTTRFATAGAQLFMGSLLAILRKMENSAHSHAYTKGNT